ncbi:hypothetical protein AB1L88_09535 [Tautonia sp. JC769]|uniref:hypothetical protein n=1 Tax=Tautonia sp. JC769 TaxID=3232135 RepID=UPI00345890E2
MNPISVTGPGRELERLRELLRRRRGGEACPWSWSPSHSWFTLRITRMGLAGNLHLGLGDAERVEFENRLLDIDLLIDVIEDTRRKARGGWPSSARFRVRDRDRLLVECSLLRVEFNVPPVFGIP